MSSTFPTIGLVIPGPSEVGDLRLSRVLGAGAFGIVFEAESKTHQDQRFAVKFLQAGILATDLEQQALYNEVLAAREVTHPNVIRLLHVGLQPGLPPYLVSEYADAGSLLDRLKGARAVATQIPLDLVRAWSLELMNALSAINARVIHRDVKPDNVLFAGSVLKVADFGLAKLVGAATRAVTFKGGQHVLYMAPEAWEGQRNEIQIDMYAVGIVLFEVSTLRFPYKVPETDNLEDYRRMHLLQTPVSARSLRSDLPRRFDEVIMRLLSKRPQDRYRTWDDAVSAASAAFAESGTADSQAVNELLEQAGKRHQLEVERRLVTEAKARKEREEMEIDAMQQEEIVKKIRVIVEHFNEGTEGPKASFRNEHGIWSISFPYARSATLSFFGVRPPLDLSPFTVRHVGLLADDKGCGFNLLLQRHVNDVHGQWVVCQVRASPISGRAHRHCQYFGLGRADVEHIERGHRAMHIFIPEISADVDRSLSLFVRSLYESAK